MNESGFFALDVGALPWEKRESPRRKGPLYRKALHTDPETGMFVQVVRYPPGVVNPDHTHPCAHGAYVLEGTLLTHRGRFGPGSFVWFPEGEVMSHGATADAEVVVLLFTNKAFGTTYVDPTPG